MPLFYDSPAGVGVHPVARRLAVAELDGACHASHDMRAWPWWRGGRDPGGAGRATTAVGRRYPIAVLCVLLALGVAALDILSPLGVAAGALYSAVIVVSMRAEDARVVRYTAGVCTAFIVVGAFLSVGSAVPLWIVVLNRALFVVVVWVTALLVLYGQHAAHVIRDQQEQLERANRELDWQAHNDALTDVANRRYFDEQLALECGRANRTRTPLSLLMIDVDHFKDYNDAAGHPAGDECLRAVAGAIQKALRRPVDFVARYGGEEFAVILPATALPGARERAEEIRRGVRRLGITHPGFTKGDSVTVSVGVGGQTPPVSPEELVRRADEALYRAKETGRDRVVGGD